MTQLKIDIKFNSSCTLSVTDTTGFRNLNNPTGFVLEGDSLTLEGDYKISQGYFVDLLSYHSFFGKPQIINTSDYIQYIESTDVNPIYANNFETKNFTLNKDGVYSFKRIFVISSEFYYANQETITKVPVFYKSDESAFYTIEEGIEKLITLAELSELVSSDTTGSLINYKFISTCYLNKCLYLLQTNILNSPKGGCNVEPDLIKQRDYLMMTLNVIKYLKEDGHLTEVQRVIETSDTCGSVCKQIARINNDDCGCG